MIQTKLTKRQMLADKRTSDQIDVSKEPDMYFMKLAYEEYGNATRDNSASELVQIGMDLERGVQDETKIN
jgi:hypothetical protein